MMGIYTDRINPHEIRYSKLIFWFDENFSLTIEKSDEEIRKVDRYLRTKSFTGYIELNKFTINLNRVCFYEMTSSQINPAKAGGF